MFPWGDGDPPTSLGSTNLLISHVARVWTVSIDFQTSSFSQRLTLCLLIRMFESGPVEIGGNEVCCGCAWWLRVLDWWYISWWRALPASRQVLESLKQSDCPENPSPWQSLLRSERFDGKGTRAATVLFARGCKIRTWFLRPGIWHSTNNDIL